MSLLRIAAFLILILLPFLITQSFAQSSGGITGLVVDSIEQQGLGFASVMLFEQQSDIQIAGMLADSGGTFSFTNLPPGQYNVSVSFLGYLPAARIAVTVAEGHLTDLGNIIMQPTRRLMEEIEITGRKASSFHTMDRQVFLGSQFSNAAGGNASDLIANLPGVAIDALGNISLRGSQGFVVMIDGTQIQTDAATILQQLPANSIERIEILTTPSARFDPDGKGGVIHIITKRGQELGWFATVNTIFGAPGIETYNNADPARRYGADITLTYRQAQWEIAGGLDYRRDDLAGQRIGYVNTLIGDVLTEFPSMGERSFDRYRYSGRINLRVNPADNHEWNLRFLAGDRTDYRTADILYAPQQRIRLSPDDIMDPMSLWEAYQQTGHVFQRGSIQDTLTYFNENLRVRQGDFLIGGLDYTWNISEQRLLSASALVERTILGGPTDNASLAWPEISDTLQYQYNTNDNPLTGIRLNLDYSQQLGGAALEAGYQYRHLLHPGDFVYLDRDLEADIWLKNSLFTNRIELRRTIHSLYGQVSGSLQRWSYNAGLRLEYMDRSVGIAAPDTTYLYSIIQPFPSLQLQYASDQDWTFRGSYSRRIDRTTTFKMTPFPEREHNETLEQGTATLLPEFIDVFEMGVEKRWQDHRVYLTGYHRNIRNVINRVNSVFNDTILNRIYTNAGDARATGAELATYLYPADWCEIYLGSNVYRYSIQGTLFGTEINTATWIWSLNSRIGIRPAPTWHLDLAMNYLSERVTAQGVDSRFYHPSLVLRKSFLEGRLSASLQWQSIDLGLLSSNEQRISTWQPDFFTTTNYVYEVDRILVTLSYQIRQSGKKSQFIEAEFGKEEF